MFLCFRNDFSAAWMNLGIVLSASSQYKEAEKCYTTAISYRAKYPDCYYNLGLLVIIFSEIAYRDGELGLPAENSDQLFAKLKHYFVKKKYRGTK